MRKEVKLLKEKATNSLLLSIEHFNRPWDRGRSEAVLILLDHSFEMLLKASILHRDGRIREPREKNTIGFDACIRRALSNPTVRFLIDEQALVLQSINGLRDAAQHHIVELSEGQLYFHAQSGVTLFRDILLEVFGEQLSDSLPERVLPISTASLQEPMLMFIDEMEQIRKLLAPGTRKQAEAEAKIRSLAIVDGAILGEFTQPSSGELRKIGNEIRNGQSFEQTFPGIASVKFSAEGSGAHISLRITKKDGIPVSLVPEGTPHAGVVAVKRVDELGFYNLGHRELSIKVGLTTNKTTAAIAVLDLKNDVECFKAFKIGGTRHQRYSQRAVAKINELLQIKSTEQIWVEYRSTN